MFKVLSYWDNYLEEISYFETLQEAKRKKERLIDRHWDCADRFDAEIKECESTEPNAREWEIDESMDIG